MDGALLSPTARTAYQHRSAVGDRAPGARRRHGLLVGGVSAPRDCVPRGAQAPYGKEKAEVAWDVEAGWAGDAMMIRHVNDAVGAMRRDER